MNNKAPDPTDVKQFSSDKILAHLDRIDEWLRTGMSRPITFELDMTNICNHKCPACFGFSKKGSKDSMNLEEARDIIYQIKEAGGKGLTFTGGGEPLCNPATTKAVEYARKIGLDVGFITNGALVDRTTARILLKNSIWIRVSLDAATPEMFKLSHGVGEGAFEKIVSNIKLLVREKKELDSRTTIGAGYLTSPATSGEMYKFAMLCRDLKVDYAQFRPLLPSFGSEKADCPASSQKTILGEIKKSMRLSKDDFEVLYSKHKYDCIADGKVARSYDDCYGHHFAAVVAADKRMYICCHFRGVKKYCIGDLKKNTIGEIWRSMERKRVYAGLDLRDCVPLCRCNTFNAVLWNIKQKKMHQNFI